MTLTEAAIFSSDKKRVYYLWEKYIIDIVENSTDLDAHRQYPANTSLFFKKVKTTEKLCGYIKCHAGNVFKIYRREIPEKKKTRLILLREV
jgi:hypothetical protein